METIGFEPMTLCVQSIRSTNWTTSPYGWQDSNLYDYKAPGPKPDVSTNFTTPALILTLTGFLFSFLVLVLFVVLLVILLVVLFVCKDKKEKKTNKIDSKILEWVVMDSNHWPFRCKRIALPTELNTLWKTNLVKSDEGGFEPPILIQYAGFQDRYLKPLRHSSLNFVSRVSHFVGLH
jgi:hypothetical protein